MKHLKQFSSIRHLVVLLVCLIGAVPIVAGLHFFYIPYVTANTDVTVETKPVKDEPEEEPVKEPVLPSLIEGPESTITKSATSKTSPLDLKTNRAIRQGLLEKLGYADYLENGLLLDMGSKSFQLRNKRANYWKKTKTEQDGSTNMQMAKNICSINLFLPDAKSYFAHLRVKAGRENQKISLTIGKNKTVKITLDKRGLASYLMDLKEAGNISGYNTLTIEADSSPLPSFDYIRFIPVNKNQQNPGMGLVLDNPVIKVPESEIFQTKLSQTSLPSIPIKNEGGLIYHLYVPRTTRLLWRMKVERPQKSLKQLTFLIRIVSPAKPAKIAYVKSFAKSADHSEQVFAIDLTEYAEDIVRLEFLANGGEDNDKVLLIDPALENYMPPQDYKEWIPPENVVIYLSDTLRWDKINFNKPKDNVIITPNFDKISREGIAFTNAISQGSWSVPSQAALMGGRYPWTMRKEDSKKRPPVDTELIATAIKKQKREIVTASYSSNGYVSNAFGFGQKWDYSRNMIREGKPNRTEYLYKAMFPVFERDNVIDKQFFLWLGTIDPHVAYNPRKSFLELYDKKPYRGVIKPYKTASILLDIKRGKLKPSKRDWERLVALYHGEVSYNDHHMGVLIDKLKEWNILEQTAIILISDHGDAFLEHNDMGHGGSVYDELIRVPMVIYYPRGFPRARVVDSAVETMGLYPTAMEMLSLTSPKNTQAESLLPYAFGIEPLWPKLARSNNRKAAYLSTVGPWRMILKSRNRRELFNYKSDPYEENNLAETRPDVLYYLLSRYAEWKSQYK